MDKFLEMCIDANTPKLNPLLANGVAVTQLKQAPQFIDSAIQSASRSFVKGLQYLGYSRCTPYEEYQFRTASGRSRRAFDVARSDFYMMKYRFSFNGEELKPRYMCLPFVSDAGYITLNGAKHLISPTLNDIVFSVTDDTVFVRLQRDRFRFHRLQHGYVVNGERTEMTSVIWSQIHKKLERRAAVNAHTTAFHYLLVKYGFTKTFELFAGFAPVIGEGREINEDNYPKDQWVILSSTGMKPRAIKSEWHVSPIKIAIPLDRWDQNLRLKAMVSGFFYIVDHFPNRVRAEWVDSTRLWKILLGKLIHDANTNEGTLVEKIDEHISSVDDYMDLHVIRLLREIGYDIDDFYELLMLVLERFSEWIALSTNQINSMNGKELNVNSFTLLPITSSIFRTVYSLNKRYNVRHVITVGDIDRAFKQFFKPTKMFDIVSKRNSEVSSLTTSNDNKALRLTSIIVPQTPSNVRGSGTNLNDPALRLHSSIAEFGGYTYLPKRHPDGRSRLNHCALVDENFRLIRNLDFIPLLDQTDKLINIR